MNLADDEIIDSLQESMNELRRSKLDIPPPPGPDERPTLANIGRVPERNSYITASKRARMSGDRTSTISVPIGRPPSPESPKKRIGTSPLAAELGANRTEVNDTNEKSSKKSGSREYLDSLKEQSSNKSDRKSYNEVENTPNKDIDSKVERTADRKGRDKRNNRKPESDDKRSTRKSDNVSPEDGRRSRKKDMVPPSDAAPPPPSYEDYIQKTGRASGRRQKSKEKIESTTKSEDPRKRSLSPKSRKQSSPDNPDTKFYVGKYEYEHDGHDEGNLKPGPTRRGSTHSNHSKQSALSSRSATAQQNWSTELRTSQDSRVVVSKEDHMTYYTPEHRELSRSASPSDDRHSEQQLRQTSSRSPNIEHTDRYQDRYSDRDSNRQSASSYPSSPSPNYVINGDVDRPISSSNDVPKSGVWKRVPPPYQNRPRNQSSREANHEVFTTRL